MTKVQKSRNISTALQKWKSHFWSVVSFCTIIFYGLIALFAYLLAPDHSQNANQMHLSIHSKPPGYSTKMLIVPNNNTSDTSYSFISRFFKGTPSSDTEIPFHSLKIDSTDLIIFRHPKQEISTAQRISLSTFETTDFQKISRRYTRNTTFWLGTDKYGRDMLSRLLIGSRISFSIGFVAVFISLFIGIIIGAISGYFGGWIDSIMVWLMNVLWSIPTLLLVIAITLALGKGLLQVYIAVGLTMWVEVARVVRGQVMSVKENQYITATKVLGFSHFRRLFYHILPNSFSPVIVIAASNFASAILIESGLSFLGIGAQPPIPSWGSMIKDHYPYIILGKAYMALIPGVALMTLVMSFMLLGNGIRDWLAVKK